MTDTLERDLRRSLADHVADASRPADRSDPWDRVQRGVVARRRRRAGALALAVALGGGLAVLQPWAGGEPVQPATVERSGWGLDDGTPRGALAGDEELRAGVEDVFAASLAGPSGGGSELVRGSTRLVFADDVAGTRLVVAVATAQGVGAVGGLLTGPEGSSAADLVPGATPPGAVVGTAPAVATVVAAEDGPRLLAVVPPGAQVSVSDALRVEGGDTLGREWREMDVSAEGLVDTALSAEPASGLAVLRVDAAPGYDTDPAQAVAELALPWPGPFDEAPLVGAQEVVARGQHEFRDGAVPRPVAEDQVAQDVSAVMEQLGRPNAADVRLLYASRDGADVDRGAGGWSSLVEVRAGEGTVVSWQLHDDAGGLVGRVVVPAPEDTGADLVLMRMQLADGTELVGAWDEQGTLSATTVDGEDAVMPEALGFRWFPVESGAAVTINGAQVPPARQGTSTPSWLLPGEERPGPEPLFGS